MNVQLHHAVTRDVDQQAALLNGWNQSYTQLSAGAFEGRIDEVWLDGLHLFVEHTSGRLQQHGALAPRRLALGLPLRTGDGPATFCGASDWQGDLQHGRLCTFSGRQGFEFHTPPGLTMAGIDIDLDELGRLSTPDEQERLERLGQSARLHQAGRAAVENLRLFMHGVFDMLAREPDLLDDPAARSTLRQAAQSHVLELAAAEELTPVDVPTGAQRQAALVAQAQDWVRHDPETPHTVATLCAHLGVSRRTLQSAFCQVLGVAPATYLRAVRLAGARRALGSAGSVTEAAAQWGFWHFGHFANDYRRQFGELPSSTWRRMHCDGPLN